MVKYVGPSLAVFFLCAQIICLLDISCESTKQADASLFMVDVSPVLPFYLHFVNNFSAAIHKKFSQMFAEIFL
jgi:hypothetical protein